MGGFSRAGLYMLMFLVWWLGEGLGTDVGNGDSVGLFRWDTTMLSGKIVFEGRRLVLDAGGRRLVLIGEARVEYGSMTLEAPVIVLDWSAQVVVARRDSGGLVRFREGQYEFLLDSLKYQLRTGSAVAYQVRTTALLEESQLAGGRIKRKFERQSRGDTLREVYYVSSGVFTTCDTFPPHYYVYVRRGKWVPNRLVVSGSGWLTVSGEPLPVWLPFFLFPVTKQGQSGVILPTVGESPVQGFALRNGGYYLALNDYVHFALTGDLFTSGTYRVSLESWFRRRYLLEGEMRLTVARTYTGLPLFPETREYRDVGVFMRFRLGGAYLPNLSVHGRVELTTRTFWQNTMYEPDLFLRNNVASGVQLAYRFGSVATVQAGVTHRMNARSGLVYLGLPDVQWSVYRRSLLRRRGVRVWWSVHSRFLHLWRTTDSVFFSRWLPIYGERGSGGVSGSGSPVDFRVWEWRTTVPMEVFVRVLRYVQVRGGWTHRWSVLSHGLRLRDSVRGVPDTVYAPWGLYQGEARLSVHTAVYGLWRIGSRGRLRHVVQPGVEWVWRPVGYPALPTYVWVDSLGIRREWMRAGLSPLGVEVLVPVHRVQFVVRQRVEVKRRREGGVKKEVWVPEWRVVVPWWVGDSVPFREVRQTVRVQPGGLPVYVQAVVVHIPEVYPRFLPVSGLRLSAGYSGVLGESVFGGLEGFGGAPWVSLGFNVQYGEGVVRPVVEGSLRWRVTPRWQVQVYSGYDFAGARISYTSVRLLRDLHCWELALEWYPVGWRRGYFLRLSPKASFLRSVKIQHRREWFEQWR